MHIETSDLVPNRLFDSVGTCDSYESTPYNLSSSCLVRISAPPQIESFVDSKSQKVVISSRLPVHHSTSSSSLDQHDPSVIPPLIRNVTDKTGGNQRDRDRAKAEADKYIKSYQNVQPDADGVGVETRNRLVIP